MTHFLRHFPWEAVAVIVALAGTAFVAFRVGRRWRRGYRDALRNKREYHMLKADAQLRSAQTQGVHVEVSPVITAGVGMQSDVRQSRRADLDRGDALTACPWCDRFGCRSDCREARLDGPDQLVRGHDTDSRLRALVGDAMALSERSQLDLDLVRERAALRVTPDSVTPPAPYSQSREESWWHGV